MNLINHSQTYYYILIVIFSFVFNSVFVDKICLILLIFNIWRLGNSQTSFLNPFFLFLPVPISLFLCFNFSDTYFLDIKHETYLLAILNIVAFISGLKIFLLKKERDIAFKIYPKKKIKNVTFSRALVIAIFLGIASLADDFIFLSSVLWPFTIPAIVLSFKTKNKVIISLILFYLFFLVLTFSSKMQILLYLLTIVISIEKYFRISKKILTLLSASAFLILLLSFTFANKERGYYDADKGLDYYTSQGVNWGYNSNLFLPYMYLTTPWTNLQYVTETQNTRTFGLWTLKPIISYFQIDDLFIKEYELIPYSSFNTFTFIAIFFKDFGFFLSIIPSFLLALIIGKVYQIFIFSENSFIIAVYSIFSLATIELFFSNHFFMLAYPFTILLLYLMIKNIKVIWTYL